MKPYQELFCDIQAPLSAKKAEIESSRCYYCYDAPCIQACPTQIDIPSFIRKISNGNTRGAAIEILSANIMGGTCARACPVETLCQQACVREKAEQKPVLIGQLQRFATDEFFKTGENPFKREKANGMKVAVVGAGPAGMSCAHRLATLGYEITIYEAKPKSGGLNEYGLAPYKVTDNFVQREIDFILSVGGIRVEHRKKLGKEITLEELKKNYSAVFLGVGLGNVNALEISGEELPGVMDAVKQIEKIRQTRDLNEIEVGRHVIVIGGGNTAVDISIQMKRLGAEFVTLVYRRGREQMSATSHEQELAQSNGVLIKPWAKPTKIFSENGKVSCVEFEYTEMRSGGKLAGTGKTFTLNADQVFKAIGQSLETGSVTGKLFPETVGGKIQVNADFETTIPRVYAGGDCVGPGEDLTVTSVQQGKLAALSIHKKF